MRIEWATYRRRSGDLFQSYGFGSDAQKLAEREQAEFPRQLMVRWREVGDWNDPAETPAPSL